MTSTVSKLFIPMKRIPHNSTHLKNRCLKHTWCN